MTGKVETAQNLPRDVLRGILGPMFGGVECDHADRVAVLAGHQIADDGFEIGFADIGFRECRAEVSVIVDDEINGLIIAARHNRRNKAPAHEKLQTQRFRWNLSTKPRRRNRSGLPPTALAVISAIASEPAKEPVRCPPR